MENFENLLHGFSIAISGYHIFLMIAGVMMGLLVGVLPGLGAPNGVTLLLPLTFSMEPVSAIILLTSMYWGALFGGSTTSILFNIPGEPSSVATTFDGHPMAKRGETTEALTYAFSSAGIGALCGVALITVLSSWIASFALSFSPAEYFAVYFLAFSCFIGFGSGSMLKSAAVIALGFALTSVGMDTVSGEVRLTYGFSELLRGISFLVAVIGLFGIGELLLTMEEDLKFDSVKSKLEIRRVFKTIATLPRYWATYLRSLAIGCWMGITPGGPTAASFMSYGVAQRSGKKKFGTGIPEGIIAPETADHAAGSSAILPMLALGIPGSATAAVMMGGLLIWGLNPGPMLFVQNTDFVWGLIASMYLGNVIGVIFALATVPFFAVILRVRFAIVAPLIMFVCLIGAYTVASASFDMVLLAIFGVVGYLFKKLDYPIAPFVLAMVLGQKAEDAFRQSLMISQGSLSVFFSNWLVGSVMTAGIAMIAIPALIALWRRRRPSLVEEV
ncbi:tripartite tricarboxylate transporter permease [Ochrobactrum sp. C6C9]|uniref:tripartite tricarboxylate transporter permease n=1 Tax=Ochrobactrum sp. C6C9 TaxID=2736662 RepID=UPI00352FFC00|nr:tripartite tricarboxylate transporter permease [Ochrobactrum sp. C6C9]